MKPIKILIILVTILLFLITLPFVSSLVGLGIVILVSYGIGLCGLIVYLVLHPEKMNDEKDYKKQKKP